MKTILVVFTDKLTVEEANNRKMKKYCYNTDSEVEIGTRLVSNKYDTPMLVTDILNKDYLYYNSVTGELCNEIQGTNYYPIKTLTIEDKTSDIVAVKV